MSKTRNILWATSLILACSLPSSSAFADESGAVCLGPNLMKAPYTEKEHVSLTIDDSAPIDFLRQSKEPRLVMSGLNLEKIHQINVIYQGAITHSWKLDFRKFKTKLVQIWRAPGTWKMKDACDGACGSSLKCR